mmetsp:Transcript_53790/g.64905  ORF Transcript_53790/g.64905 Transcript_53790/m.64905 type:complete len:139 (+) Transcript_53790:191-607(+)|eukprot:CAMPEP_0172497408 /NCGR_PEP_ID=MMETSP1066-20121228/99402_1 /TAXON_ID=671091 /ORGANISM="Coscinodiscus wailesii, Strain CCMP2513" /LENGTH=138 /DNA_ID=CAMNT_0013270157 /DNA_START=185 /DNA_END=601 /DNA_ORIENTATION=-
MSTHDDKAPPLPSNLLPASTYHHTSNDIPVATPVIVDTAPARAAATSTTTARDSTGTNNSDGDPRHDNITLRDDLGRHPKPITCPYCGKEGWTEVKDEKGKNAWLGGLGSMMGNRQMKETVHKCFHCRQIVGRTRAFK